MQVTMGINEGRSCGDGPLHASPEDAPGLWHAQQEARHGRRRESDPMACREAGYGLQCARYALIPLRRKIGGIRPHLATARFACDASCMRRSMEVRRQRGSCEEEEGFSGPFRGPRK